MKSVHLQAFGPPDVLTVVEGPIPDVPPESVLVRVSAAAVHPADLAARAGAFGQMLPAADQLVLGWDFAGTVAAVGPGALMALGDPVIGGGDWLRDRNGTHAEFVVVHQQNVVAAPAGVRLEDAASLPINALTAAQAVDLIEPAGGQTVVIVGAAGNVGGFALELMSGPGVQIIGIGASSDEAFIAERGALFVDRTAGWQAVQARASVPIDAVFDTASVGQPAVALVRDEGRYVGVIPPLLPARERGVSVQSVNVRYHRETLIRISKLAESGRLTARIAARYPLERAAEAHRHRAVPGIRGAVLLTP